jgi:hypothetical protein
VQRIFQHPSSLTHSWRPAPKVFRELGFCELVFRERFVHSKGSETATMEQDFKDSA